MKSFYSKCPALCCLTCIISSCQWYLIIISLTYISNWPLCQCHKVNFNTSFLILFRSIIASLVAQMVKSPPAMQEPWVQSLGWEDPLEKGMLTHSSILAWRIPWTEEPSRLQSMESQELNITEQLTLLLHYVWNYYPINKYLGGFLYLSLLLIYSTSSYMFCTYILTHISLHSRPKIF